MDVRTPTATIAGARKGSMGASGFANVIASPVPSKDALWLTTW